MIWTSDSVNAELGFVIQSGQMVLTVESKPTTNLQGKSLKTYREKYFPEASIRTSLADYNYETDLYDIPLFMIEGIQGIINN